MIIGFSEKTSKIIPKLVCKKFRHCAILIKLNGIQSKYLLLNPTVGKVDLFLLKIRDLKILENHGWIFINTNEENNYISLIFAFTCVGFVKKAINIKNPFIWTPDQLYRKLTIK